MGNNENNKMDEEFWKEFEEELEEQMKKRLEEKILLKEELEKQLENMYLLEKKLEEDSRIKKLEEKDSKRWKTLDLELSVDEIDESFFEEVDINNIKSNHFAWEEIEKQCEEKIGEMQNQRLEDFFKEYLNNTIEEKKVMTIVNKYPIGNRYPKDDEIFFEKLKHEGFRGGEKSFNFRCELLERMNLQEVVFLFLPIALVGRLSYNIAYEVEDSIDNKTKITIFFYEEFHYEETPYKHEKVLMYSLIIYGTFDSTNKNIFMLSKVEAISVKSDIRIEYEISKPVNLTSLFKRGIKLSEEVNKNENH